MLVLNDSRCGPRVYLIAQRVAFVVKQTIETRRLSDNTILGPVCDAGQIIWEAATEQKMIIYMFEKGQKYRIFVMHRGQPASEVSGMSTTLLSKKR
jgi:hypothetical protein